jgi:hypothetical protein
MRFSERATTSQKAGAKSRQQEKQNCQKKSSPVGAGDESRITRDDGRKHDASLA